MVLFGSYIVLINELSNEKFKVSFPKVFYF